MFLKELTELSGVSGNEYKVRNFIKKKLEEIDCNYTVDKLGNIIAHNVGNKKINKTIMLAAHMDEVGFIVTGIDESGFIKFKSVGGIDDRILIAKVVEIGENRINGVIGSKPVHLMSKDERGKPQSIDKLYIDIGSISKDETEKIVKIGDYISFKSKYVEFGENMIKAKALDDRIGCCILLRILKEKLDLDFYVAFTVMEEVGLIGAKVAAYNISPDYSIVLEGTISADMPEVDEHEKVTRIGCGPAISIMDRTTLYDLNLIEHIQEVAKTNNIPCQIRQSTSGGNDAGVIHTNKSGSKVLSISVPCRYIHSPVSVVSKLDYENTFNLIVNVIKEFI